MQKELFFTVLVFLGIKTYSIAQCAMCRAVVEANLEAGGTSGAGLNHGILYLMVMPYIGVAIFALFYYFQKKRKAIDA